ncbi:MAG: leucine--tRNA ligase [Patescibacteria group bacterium]|nr:leucine--tRNA ligase [Patescibacteria group bacterium]
MKNYNHKEIEEKWQKKWEEDKIYEVKNPSNSSGQEKQKFYGLIEFPYPSGDGMHTGHLRSNTAMDIICRKRRMQGFNVLYPIGWDAFGLPTENYAIKMGLDPAVVTKQNTDNFRKQLKSAGFSFDWSREINTTDPQYYKWTQWIFLQFFKNNLAYKKKMTINWCPSCKIGLANEEVVDSKCERCGTSVEKKEKEQWMLAITKYAERLDKDLDEVDYLDRIKIQQRNWIGKSEGSEIEFKLVGARLPQEPGSLKVFTTRADTLLGATYVVLAPEHELIEKLKPEITNWDDIVNYIAQTKNKTEIQRTTNTSTGSVQVKTGVELKGVKVINPANNEELPIWIADYVLASYGTGAIMAVPAHDERDSEFAKKYNLPIKEIEVNDTEEGRKKMTETVGGKMVTTFKLRDWIFSRQRYWGEPIPMINCIKCGWVPVPEESLPVILPEVENYKATDTGESPLSKIDSWVNTKCPKCKGSAKRETDTMPNWAGSSWYYLRYIDPNNDQMLADIEKLKYWTPVNWYNGGMEHTTLHLLYSRFWHKFLFDIGVVPTSEPYQKRTSHGFILAENGEKMSKSRGNVVNPDQIIETYGADTLRVYEMFAAPFEQEFSWKTESIIGPRRFIEKIWKLKDKISDVPVENNLEKKVHQAIKKIGDDIETMSFNTSISHMMILANEMEKAEKINQSLYELFLKILCPFAPHVTEELWYELGHTKSIHTDTWPAYYENKIKDEKVKMVVQVNGKIRTLMEVESNMEEQEITKKALKNKDIIKWVEDKDIKKTIFVKNKLINFVVE